MHDKTDTIVEQIYPCTAPWGIFRKTSPESEYAVTTLIVKQQLREFSHDIQPLLGGQNMLHLKFKLSVIAVRVEVMEKSFRQSDHVSLNAVYGYAERRDFQRSQWC